jgi:RimJ/RimL family protein N-acetyltransferase
MNLKLKGTRINLRKLKKTDAYSICKHANDRDVSRYLSNMRYPYRLSYARKYIWSTWANLRKKTDYDLGIEHKETGKIIGMISLMKIDTNSKNAEIGYWLGKRHWGKGITSEAARLILDFGFNRLKLARVYARVVHPNTASVKVLTKLGFQPEGKNRKHIMRNGKWYDELRFGLLKEEYLKKRGG